MSNQVVTYQVDGSTTVSFEIEPTQNFRPASGDHVPVKIRDAVTPAVEAAKSVLDKVKEICPDEIELTFGIKVSGGANWLIARSAGEANFEIKLTWSSKDMLTSDPPPADDAEETGNHTGEPDQK